MFSKLQSVVLVTAALLRLSSAGVVVSSRNSDFCGRKGYDHGNKSNYYWDDSRKLNNYAACSAKCLGDSTCKSFAVGEACMLFNIPLNGNFDADDGSSDIYYDKGCLSSSSTSSTKTTTSAKMASTSLSSSLTSSSKIMAPSTTPATSSKINSVSSTAAKTPTTSSTISMASISAASSSTSSATPAVTVPSGCPAPTSVELTNLSWFNSTHNLDCPNPNYPSGAQVCFDGTHVCVDETNGVAGGPVVCTCVPFCYTGLPSYAYQPIGYGPPDNITINLSDPAQPSCTAVMPTGFRDFEIGLGHVNCGSAQDILEFYGDSNKDVGNTGTLNYFAYIYSSYTACNGTPRYSGSFPLSCTRDAGGNATCGLQNGAATLSLVSIM